MHEKNVKNRMNSKEKNSQRKSLDERRASHSDQWSSSLFGIIPICQLKLILIGFWIFHDHTIGLKTFLVQKFQCLISSKNASKNHYSSHFIVSSKKSNFEICLEFQDFHAIFLLLWIKYSKSIFDFKLLNSSLGN